MKYCNYENKDNFLEEEDYNVEELKHKHKQFLNENRIIMILQQSFKSDHHDTWIVNLIKKN